MVDTRYNYVHDQKYSSEDVDIHHIVLKNNGGKYFFVYASALLVLACGIYLYLLEVCMSSNKFYVWFCRCKNSFLVNSLCKIDSG